MATTGFSVAIGNTGERYEQWTLQPHCRTAQQFETVRQIVQSPNFAFACLSRLFELTSNYRGKLVFTYYTKDGVMHNDSITPAGRVKFSV